MMLSAFTESMILLAPVVTAVAVAATNIKSVATATITSTSAIVAVIFAAVFS
jgi:hypothetical protein